MTPHESNTCWDEFSSCSDWATEYATWFAIRRGDSRRIARNHVDPAETDNEKQSLRKRFNSSIRPGFVLCILVNYQTQKCIINWQIYNVLNLYSLFFFLLIQKYLKEFSKLRIKPGLYGKVENIPSKSLDKCNVLSRAHLEIVK